MSNLELFPAEKKKTYGETAREKMHALAISDHVKAETMAVFIAHYPEFIWFNEPLRAVKYKYDLGSYFNDTLHHLEHEGKLERRHVYHGATSPVGAATDLAGKRPLKKGEKAPLPYRGYSVEYRAAPSTIQELTE